MSLSERSLDQLARLRRLLHRFAAPDPGVRLITVDAEAHAAALDPELAMLHLAPFGGLSNVETADAPTVDGGLRDPRTSRSSATSSEGARRQRREKMLEPSKPPQSGRNAMLPGTFKSPSGLQALASKQHASNKTPEVNASAKNKSQHVETSNEVAQDKRASVSNPSAISADNSGKPDKSVIALPVAMRKAESSQSSQIGSENKIELDTLVQRVLRKRRHLRDASVSKRASFSDQLQPSALPPRARLDATVIQQRPLPPSLVLPVSPATARSSQSNAVVVTQHSVRKNITELVTTPNGVNKGESLERTRTRPATHATFFFNALEPREADASEESLTDRIDQVLREQARRQGVDLT